MKLNRGCRPFHHLEQVLLRESPSSTDIEDLESKLLKGLVILRG